METNNIPKIAVNITTDSHQGVVLRSARAVAFAGVLLRLDAVVLRRAVVDVAGLSQ